METADVVKTAAGVYWIRNELGVMEERIITTLQHELVGKLDYSGEIKSRFDRLLLLLTKFLRLRTDARGALVPYLKRIEDGDPPLEADLQGDLWLFLTGTDFPETERSNVSAGRADIFIPQGRFRFVVEVKRSFETWSDQMLAPFLRQTTAYQQTDVRLGILAVLDLSDRPAGTPHLDQCFLVRERIITPTDRRFAVIMRVPGNRRTPSDSADGQCAA